MKKILLVLICTLLLLVTSIKSVNAEEVEEIPTSSPTEEVIKNEEINDEEIIESEVENITIEDEEQPSDLQVWFEENLAWFIGLPTGGALTLLSFAIMVHKEKKEKRADIQETKNQNANANKLLTLVKSNLIEVKELSDSLAAANVNLLTHVNNTDKRINDLVTSLTVKVTLGLETLTTTVSALESRLSKLEDVQEMIALHSKELVANGTAEEIHKKLRG